MKRAERIEISVDVLAAAASAGAAGFALQTAAASPALAASGALLVLLGTWRILRSVGAVPPAPAFTPFDVKLLFDQADELLLSEAQMVRTVQAGKLSASDELELDDILEQLGPDARVVRLFDRDAMPSPGQLKERIDRHVGGRSSNATPLDASQDLLEALAELRRSLR